MALEPHHAAARRLLTVRLDRAWIAKPLHRPVRRLIREHAVPQWLIEVGREFSRKFRRLRAIKRIGPARGCPSNHLTAELVHECNSEDAAVAKAEWLSTTEAPVDAARSKQQGNFTVRERTKRKRKFAVTSFTEQIRASAHFASRRRIQCGLLAVDTLRGVKPRCICAAFLRRAIDLVAAQWIVAEVDDERRVLHVVGEVIKQGGTTTDEHAERTARWIMAHLERTKGRRYTREEVFAMKIKAHPDASGASLHTTSTLSDIHLLLQAGFRPDHPKANPPIMERVNTLNVLLRDRRMTIDAEACPHLCRALETQALDRNGEPEKKAGPADMSHILDALGYAAHRLFPVHRRANVVRSLADDVVDDWGRVA